MFDVAHEPMTDGPTAQEPVEGHHHALGGQVPHLGAHLGQAASVVGGQLGDDIVPAGLFLRPGQGLGPGPGHEGGQRAGRLK